MKRYWLIKLWFNNFKLTRALHKRYSLANKVIDNQTRIKTLDEISEYYRYLIDGGGE